MLNSVLGKIVEYGIYFIGQVVFLHDIQAFFIGKYIFKGYWSIPDNLNRHPIVVPTTVKIQIVIMLPE